MEMPNFNEAIPVETTTGSTPKTSFIAKTHKLSSETQRIINDNIAFHNCLKAFLASVIKKAKTTEVQTATIMYIAKSCHEEFDSSMAIRIPVIVLTNSNITNRNIYLCNILYSTG